MVMKDFKFVHFLIGIWENVQKKISVKSKLNKVEIIDTKSQNLNLVFKVYIMLLFIWI